jgi:DNA-binding NarL/FixJ family response regulator
MERIKVLVAERRPIFREGLCGIINAAEGMEVVGAVSSSNELVEWARDCLPDVVLLDFNLPGLSGEETIQQLKQISPTISILVTTNRTTQSCLCSCLQLGAAGYLLRDISPQRLIQAIRGVYYGEAVVDLIAIRKAAEELLGPRREYSRNPPKLHLRELEVLQLAAKGMSNKDIAQQLYISIRTVQSHFRSIFTKVGAGSRTEAVYHALHNGWIRLEELNNTGEEDNI